MLGRLAGLADLVFAGDDELRLLARGLAVTLPDAIAAVGDPQPSARAIADATGAEVVLKRGALGAIVVAGASVAAAQAVPVEVVDTVGAGDAFAAAYLAERLLGRDLDERLRTAVRAGALACTHPGDWQGFPLRDDLERAASDPVDR